LEQKRRIMKAITGADFQDNEWGFGQVIAIFLWVPLLVQTLYWAIGKYPLILLCAWMCLLKVERDKPPAETSPEDAIESGDNSQDIDETGEAREVSADARDEETITSSSDKKEAGDSNTNIKEKTPTS
jgi:hypothetical protein